MESILIKYIRELFPEEGGSADGGAFSGFGEGCRDI